MASPTTGLSIALDWRRQPKVNGLLENAGGGYATVQCKPLNSEI